MPGVCDLHHIVMRRLAAAASNRWNQQCGFAEFQPKIECSPDQPRVEAEQPVRGRDRLYLRPLDAASGYLRKGRDFRPRRSVTRRDRVCTLCFPVSRPQPCLNTTQKAAAIFGHCAAIIFPVLPEKMINMLKAPTDIVSKRSVPFVTRPLLTALRYFLCVSWCSLRVRRCHNPVGRRLRPPLIWELTMSSNSSTA
jgi:hypothetical protein